MKISLYRYSMLIAAFALLALSIFYFISYAQVVSAVVNLSPFYRNSIQGLWLTFASQALLFALLYFLVAARPRSVSREVIVICGLLQLVASIMIFMFSGSMTMVYLLAGAALFVLIGSVLWPSEEELAAPPVPAALPPASAVPTAPPPPVPPVSLD
jgi:hypothetical protein